jgi:hypothetical protein
MNNFHLNADIATRLGISRRTAQKFLNPSKKKTWNMDGSNPKYIKKTLNLSCVKKGKTPTPPHPERKLHKKKKKLELGNRFFALKEPEIEGNMLEIIPPITQLSPKN